MTIGVLQDYIPNEGDAWSYTLDHLEQYFERVLALGPDRPGPPPPLPFLVDDPEREPEPFVRDLIGAYLEAAALLGQRTAQLHVALASQQEDPVFAPEEIRPHYQLSLYQSARTLSRVTFQALRLAAGRIPEDDRADAQKLLDLEPALLACLRATVRQPITALRIRCHGDYHLGQVLCRGNDFVVFDFEGEPHRSIGERRIKRSPLRDVASMLRSFHYAADEALVQSRAEDRPALRAWAPLWLDWVSRYFLRAYLREAAPAAFLPRGHDELRKFLLFYMGEKALYELQYDLNERPDRAHVPIRGLLSLIEQCPPQP
jgi:maltose alpha-D-glucosyltransferase/alpha-amylase